MTTITRDKARELAIAHMREMWDAIWTATFDREDLALRDQRFDAWLASAVGVETIEERLAIGAMPVGDDWVSWPPA